ncbi:hypothetical protein GALMADRAFT_235897 [Galerina marginata CBS 339.88]|uniref:Diphthine--ammonia ligase n=1 Tax=Galerina marginata (strain CBS 339.88) TaxID=685588 RepID=A0A067TUM4_GALM3|nr:hypothetical protein GALMADRAFT_235897 [Galerina marginata CBS 339.88]
MKYLALLSGGKDSCYNLVHCAQNGHELVAAASLGPEPGKEELDSYLYQTVGQDAIEFVARALEVPLYRRVITGDAVEQGSEYGGRNANNAGGVAGDETEDLYELLLTVQAHHPDVKGVSVGAILSNYQRVRVEHVCRRLELTPLCYLWQRNQGELLAEMIEAGMEAILIKVAGIGLTTSHLGKTLAQMEPTLKKLNTLYGSHICGEGGEYETLTLDCPLFKHRIKLIDTETVIHSGSDFAAVAYLRVKAAELVPKPPKPTSAQAVSTPPLLEDEFKALQGAILQSQGRSEARNLPSLHVGSRAFHHPTGPVSSIGLRKGAWVVVANIQVSLLEGENDITIEEEVIRCFDTLAERLAEGGLTLSQCCIINIFISSMDLFLRVNAVYSTFLGTSPPARACVGVDLPPGIRVRMEAMAFSEKTPFDRQALHVQGLSYWAPANIGPYSQAIAVGERVFISGQIGLLPSQLALPSPRSLATELGLASQHVARVTSALRDYSGGGWEGYTQLALYWMTQLDDLVHVKAGHIALQSSDYPTLFLVVKELPKDALVEKQVLLHTGRCPVIDEDDGEVLLQNSVPSYERGYSNIGDQGALEWELSSFKEDDSSCVIIFVKGDFRKGVTHFQELSSKMTSIVASALSIRYFYRPDTGTDMQYLCRRIFGENGAPAVTPVPCQMISSLSTDDWDLAFCVVTASRTQNQ